MPLFEKLTHIGNRSKLDSSFKSGKITHNLGDDYKNKPLVPNKKLDNNFKMNEIETLKVFYSIKDVTYVDLPVIYSRNFIY